MTLKLPIGVPQPSLPDLVATLIAASFPYSLDNTLVDAVEDRFGPPENAPKGVEVRSRRYILAERPVTSV